MLAQFVFSDMITFFWPKFLPLCGNFKDQLTNIVTIIHVFRATSTKKYPKDECSMKDEDEFNSNLSNGTSSAVRFTKLLHLKL
jgi:hypothetical protein